METSLKLLFDLSTFTIQRRSVKSIYAAIRSKLIIFHQFITFKKNKFQKEKNNQTACN